jgi:metal transporter CNNM
LFWLTDRVTDNAVLYREIIDESDVYIDVHKAIRRMAPAPKARYQRRLSHGHHGADGNDSKSSEDTKIGEEDSADNYETRKRRYNSATEAGEPLDRSNSGSPMPGTFLLRRASAGIDGRMENVPVRASYDDIRQHLKHLGPSNPASNPKATKSTTVKVKPGVVVHDAPRPSPGPMAEQVIMEEPNDEDDEEDHNETTSLLRPAVAPKDGAHALAQKYGATGQSPLSRSVENNSPAKADADDTGNKGVQTRETAPPHSYAAVTAQPPQPQQELRSKSSGSGSDLAPADPTSPYSHRSNLFARSGSITENIVESRGIRKVVLETTSSNEDEEEQGGSERNAKSASRTNLNLESHASASTEADEDASGANNPAVADAGQAEDSHTTSQADGNGNGGGSSNNKKKANRRKKRKGGK